MLENAIIMVVSRAAFDVLLFEVLPTANCCAPFACSRTPVRALVVADDELLSVACTTEVHGACASCRGVTLWLLLGDKIIDKAVMN